jgi:hypothetical protein
VSPVLTALTGTNAVALTEHVCPIIVYSSYPEVNAGATLDGFQNSETGSRIGRVVKKLRYWRRDPDSILGRNGLYTFGCMP